METENPNKSPAGPWRAANNWAICVQVDDEDDGLENTNEEPALIPLALSSWNAPKMIQLPATATEIKPNSLPVNRRAVSLAIWFQADDVENKKESTGANI